MQASYELAKMWEGLCHEHYTAEERLARLEHLEVVLRMWAGNTEDDRNYHKNAEYIQAQLEVMQILSETSHGQYDTLINEFKQERKAQEA